jgi:hypothetical protein
MLVKPNTATGNYKKIKLNIMFNEIINDLVPQTGPGRPPLKFEKCSEIIKEFLGGRKEISKDEVIKLKFILNTQGYSEGIIKKSRRFLGYDAIQEFAKDYQGIIWCKREL